MWIPQLEGLTNTARVIAIDLRGHGESEQIPGTYSMESLADDCNEILDSLAIKEKVVLCGLSMGGYISMAFIRKYASRIAGIVFTATRAAADSAEAKESRNKAISLAHTEGAAPILDGMVNRLLSPFTLTNRPEVKTYIRQMMDGISVQTIVADLQGLRDRPDSRDLLRTITQPVCILHGEDDQIIPVGEAREMQAAIPGAQLHILPQAGHLLNLEQPALFNQAVNQFLSAF
jgi:pimeloyl-ACP methyl ester carboxylesterase